MFTLCLRLLRSSHHLLFLADPTEVLTSVLVLIKMAISILQLLLWFIFMISKFCHGNPDAKRLYDDLLKKSGYNKLVRPVYNHTDAVQVKFGLSLAQLNDVVSYAKSLWD